MSNEIQRSIEYVAQYDAAFAHQIRGATAAQISRVERALGYPLPPVYRDYLERMGSGSDWIGLRQVDFSVDAVAQRLESGDWRPPSPEFTLVGVDRGESFYDAYLTSSGELVTIPDLGEAEGEKIADWMQTEAGSMAEWICGQAFQMLRVRAKHHRETLILRQRQEDALARVAAIVATQPWWFSTAYGSYFEQATANIAICALQPPRRALSLELGAPSESAANTLRDRFIRELGMVPYRK